MKCTRSWLENELARLSSQEVSQPSAGQAHFEEDSALEADYDVDPFAYLFNDPPPDTEWTDEDRERLIDAADLTLFGY